MNEALKRQYIDFLTWYDPYTCFEYPEGTTEEDSPESMLYNLISIRYNDFKEVDEDDEEGQEIVKRLDYIIGQFKAAGIKPAII